MAPPFVPTRGAQGHETPPRTTSLISHAVRSLFLLPAPPSVRSSPLDATVFLLLPRRFFISITAFLRSAQLHSRNKVKSLTSTLVLCAKRGVSLCPSAARLCFSAALVYLLLFFSTLAPPTSRPGQAVSCAGTPLLCAVWGWVAPPFKRLYRKKKIPHTSPPPLPHLPHPALLPSPVTFRSPPMNIRSPSGGGAENSGRGSGKSAEGGRGR